MKNNHVNFNAKTLFISVVIGFSSLAYGQELIPFSSEKWGFVNKKDEVVIEPKYDFVDAFSEGLASVQLKGKYGFIDSLGNEVIPLIYDFANDFKEGLAIVASNWKYGFIDKTGKIVIPFIYDGGGNFSKGRALVYFDTDDNYFYINTKGECVENCENAPENHPKVKD